MNLHLQDTIEQTQEVNYAPEELLSALKRYALRCNERVKRNWQAPTGEALGQVVVACRIYINGAISDVRVEGTTCSEAVTRSAVNAIRVSAPFEPMPPRAPQYLDLKFTFEYGITKSRPHKVNQEQRQSSIAFSGHPCKPSQQHHMC